MRADGDFMVYVAARWPTLVVEAVRLGCPPDLAADATLDALSRCRPDWGRASREEDVDRLVREELGAAVARRPRTPAEGRERAAEEFQVLAPPSLGDVRERERSNRRRTLRRTAAVAVPLLLVAAGGGWVATAGDGEPPERPGDELSAAPVVQEDNPLPGIFWYAEGRLHLDRVVVEVAGLRDMTRIDDGVVFGDAEGRVVHAADDGSLLLLGHKDPDVPVAATDETGLAAWYDPDAGRVRLVEAGTGNVRFEAPVEAGTRVVAVDRDVVYVAGADGTRSLVPAGRAPQVPVSAATLLDVRSRIRAYQKDPDTVQVVQSVFKQEFEVPGTGAQLSPDGNTVASRGEDGGVQLYDTRSGAQLDGRLGGGAEVLWVAPGDRGTVAYVVRAGDGAQVRTCELEDLHCRTVDVVGVDGDAVLAR